MRNEAVLIDQVLMGDSEKFGVLLNPYGEGILNMANRLTGDIDEAYEVCQEAFIKTFRYLKSYNSSKSFKSWIYKIVLNTYYDFIKKKKRLYLLRVQEELSGGMKEPILFFLWS